VTQLAAFQPRKFTVSGEHGEDVPEKEISLFAPELEWLASLSQQEFSAAFRGSAVKRAKQRGLVRNACIALGNAKLAPDSPTHARVSRLLEQLASGEDEMIAEHARWALAQIAARKGSSTLQENREKE
jgi:epoxyqueuosine reductase